MYEKEFLPPFLICGCQQRACSFLVGFHYSEGVCSECGSSWYLFVGSQRGIPPFSGEYRGCSLLTPLCSTQSNLSRVGRKCGLVDGASDCEISLYFVPYH